MNYNESQKLAILHKDGPMLVLAGPGSGKTAVITRRTYELIHTHGVNPSNILVITFTKAAATEMKQRFFQLSEGEGKGVTFGTFHAVFFMMLKYAYHLDKRNIVSEEQRYHLMREILQKYPLDYQDENDFIGELFTEISRIKNERINLDCFYSGVCGESVFRDIFHDYGKRLTRSRLMDFDDMLTYTYDLLSQRPDILAAWQRKYPYILIDEFQDINPIQYEIIRMLAAPKNHLFVVGDDDQSIYRFRGSKPEIMLGFEKDFPDTKRIQLSTNYRSAKEIVERSNQLICHNEHRFPKEIRAYSKQSARIRVAGFEDVKKEAVYVISRIQDALNQNIPGKEIAVLCRTNTQPRFFLEELLRYNVPFKTKDKIPCLYDHWIAKDLFAYIRLGQGSRKREDFLTIMNKPKRYLSRDSLYDSVIDFTEWMKLYEDKPWIEERIDQLKKDVCLLSTLSPYAAVNYIRKGIGYDLYLEEYAAYRNIKSGDLFDILEELQSSAKGFRTMEEWFLHMQEYKSRMEEMKKSSVENPEAITVSTLHSAKGLEYEVVFLLDANEGVMPYKKAVMDAEIEEERRLFYVGMTRAKSQLMICFVNRLWNRQVETSRFLKETGLLLE